MANRSDFLTAKIPRQIKKMLSLQQFADSHERGAAKRLWKEAHAKHVHIKTRRSDVEVSDDPAEAV